MKVNSFISSTPKRLAAVAAILALAVSTVAAPLISDVFATNHQADLESELTVRNTDGGSFSKIADADSGDVVEVKVYYHNQDDAFTGDTAKNVRVGINIPEVAGGRHTLSSTVSADNASTQTDSALVRLASDGFRLDYIEGSAKWTHNTGFDAGDEDCKTGNDTTGAPDKCFTTESISDDVVTSDAGLRLENARPCYAHEAYVTVKVKVKAPEPEPTTVTADADFNDVCAVEDDTYSVEEKTGLSYDIDDQRVDGVGTVTITATADEGYVLDGQSQWSFDFTDEPCEQPTEDVCRDGEVVTINPDDRQDTDTDVPCPEAPVEPETPEQLPNTGAAQVLMATAGTGAMGQAAVSYVKSRRSLRDVLKG